MTALLALLLFGIPLGLVVAIAQLPRMNPTSEMSYLGYQNNPETFE